MASERRPAVDATEDEQQTLDLAQRIINAVGDDPEAAERFLAALPSTEPFTQSPKPCGTHHLLTHTMYNNQQLIERSVVVSLPNDRLPIEDEIHWLANRLRMAFPVSDEEFAEVLHRITAKVPISSAATLPENSPSSGTTAGQSGSN